MDSDSVGWGERESEHHMQLFMAKLFVLVWWKYCSLRAIDKKNSNGVVCHYQGKVFSKFLLKSVHPFALSILCTFTMQADCRYAKGVSTSSSSLSSSLFAIAILTYMRKEQDIAKTKISLEFLHCLFFVLINFICFLLFIQFICFFFFLPLSRFSLHSIVACRLSTEHTERVWNSFCEHTRWGYYFSRDIQHMKYFVTKTWNMMLILAWKRNLLKRVSAM